MCFELRKLNLKTNNHHKHIAKVSILGTTSVFLSFLVTTLALFTLENNMGVNRVFMDPFYTLCPIISHFPLVIALEIGKQKRKIILTSKADKMANLVLHNKIRALSKLSNLLSFYFILALPGYMIFAPPLSDKTRDFKRYSLAVLYGTSVAFALISFFSYKTKNYLKPSLTLLIKSNEELLQSKFSNEFELKRQNKILKNILFQENAQIYFYSAFSVFATIVALLSIPYQNILYSIGNSVLAFGGALIIAKPFINYCNSQVKIKKYKKTAIKPTKNTKIEN